MNLFKGHVTQPFPAFHYRNAASSLGWVQTVLTGSPVAAMEGNAMMTNLLRGGTIAGISQWPAFKALNMTDNQATKHISKWMFAKGLTDSGHVADVLGHSAAPKLLEGLPGMLTDRKVGLSAIPEYIKSWFPRSLTQANPLNMRGVGGAAESAFAPAAAGEKLATVIEQTGRGGGALALLKQGFDMDMAAAMSKAAHVDYTSLSGFEREVMRRLVPFYSFARGNIPYQIKQVMNNPGGMTGTAVKIAARAQGEEPGFVPEHLGVGTVLRMGKDEKGQQKYLSQLGLPFEDLGNVANPSGMMGMMNPLLKGVLELATQRQFHTGRDLADVTPYTGSQVTDAILSASPLSRYASTGRALQSDIDPLAKAVQLTTGVRSTAVDPARAQRRAVEDALQDNPLIRRLSVPYVPRENVPQLTPQEMQLLRLYQQMRQQPR